MPDQNGCELKEVIKKLNDHLKSKIPQDQVELLETFVERYYASVSLEDINSHSIEDLAGALISHWNLIYQRRPDETKVRVFNPNLEKDGWQSGHTIIEVSHDDIPFLVDSIRMELDRRGILIHFAIHFGGFKVIRDSHHCIVKILPMGTTDPKATSEAPIYFEIDRQVDLMKMDELRIDILEVLKDVRLAVFDWRKMAGQVEEALYELEQNPPPLDPSEIEESKDFLRWLINNHFTFFGFRHYKLIGKGANRALQIIPGTSLGVLRDDSTAVTLRNYADLPPEARQLALGNNILTITKTNTKATVHRDDYTDCIGVKSFNEKGECIGERRFVGLYTSTAYHSSPRYIPFLRHKVEKIMQELHFPSDSHNGKEVVHILETLPRDDLFQATHEELLYLTLSILQLQERKRVRLFVRKDAYGRYFSCLVYVPRDIFTTDLCMAMQDILMAGFKGTEANYSSYFSDSVLARIHYLIRVNSKTAVEYDIAALEQKLIAVARSWSDELKSQLIEEFGEAEGLNYFSKYRKAFPSSYTEYYLPYTAIDDIKKIETLSFESPLGMIFYKVSKSALRLKIFHSEHAIALSDVLPTLENMGLKINGERPHEIIFRDGHVVWLSDFSMEYVSNKEIDVPSLKENFQDAFSAIWFGYVEDDRLNRLVLEAGLTWREIIILRAYTKYFRQIGFTFSPNYIEVALVNNASIAKELVNLFTLRFSPEYDINRLNVPNIANIPDVLASVDHIEKALQDVASLDEDKILRRFLEVMLATLRTNYFQQTEEGLYKTYISFKFDPAMISELPLPKPMYEIFVYSPRVEGVHLRGGKVARGGIRWSDRREDFRTEVLGLMKAQHVKNTVIVPVGAKGGFFPKLLPIDGDRDAVIAEVVYSYSTFIRGLLDITDNIINHQIVPPPNVIRYDDDDFYLVVAADKGTATFSDIANGISKEYQFWLDDAFASGGSAGYDHKKMGITARGAWESVKRHFREIGINPAKTDFTVIGIGDMSGDVFGNGMLLSNHIKLVGAFDHRHIFLDPNPNAQISFEERQRLFHLPRSSWADYNPKLISEGGGVFSRSLKSIKISPQVKTLLAIEKDQLAPNDLVRAMLTASVDLIFNGGIGTFVKASTESHSDVGDRTSDGIRVNGNELKARVVCEGGNLGFTQAARIEYSLNNGIIYTDFIDNSAGVDCSDHEVNIKILLHKLVLDGEMTLKQRNILLEKMTDEVAELVLSDNYQQTQILSLESSVTLFTTELFKRFMNELEKRGQLNRQLEFLPDEKTLVERKINGQGLTRPELAVLIAYSKMNLKQDILTSKIPEDPYFSKYLLLAFPKMLHKRCFSQMKEHSLRNEIIATQLAKSITDRMGVYFVERLQRETGASVEFVIRAYVIADELYRLNTLWRQIEELDWVVKPAVQQKLMLQIYFLIRRSTRWFLRNSKPDIQIEKTIADFKPPLADLMKKIPQLLTESESTQLKSTTQAYIAEGVPSVLADKIASCGPLFTSLDIVHAAIKYHFDISEVAKTYYILDLKLELNWLREQMNAYSIENQWDELARSAFRDDLDRAQKKLSISVLKLKSKKMIGKLIEERIEYWISQNKHLIDRWQNLLAEIKASPNVAFVTYSVILRELFDFAQA
jgi:glutamate dehydrogenase